MKKGSLEVSHLYIDSNNDETPEISLTVRDNTHFIVENGNDKILGTVGELINKDGFSIKINKVDALLVRYSRYLM